MWANTVTCYLSPSHAFPSNSEATQGLLLFHNILRLNDTEKQPWHIMVLQAKRIFQSKVLVKRNSILQ